jgi:hypothetical protein
MLDHFSIIVGLYTLNGKCTQKAHSAN